MKEIPFWLSISEAELLLDILDKILDEKPIDITRDEFFGIEVIFDKLNQQL